MTQLIVVEREGPVATVVLNQPDKLNALSRDSWSELGQRMRALSADAALRCVIVRGAGDKAFAAGADISEFANVRADSRQGRAYGELVYDTMQAISDCIHPIVAMIRGVCVGGGLEVALACDLRISSEGSRFGIPINRLGLTMGYGELMGLLEVVGPAVAREILLEGRVFGAHEALDKRLVHRVVANAVLEEEVRATAARIAAAAPLVARWHKRFIRRLSPQPPLTEPELNEGYACFDTEDYREGLAAFLAKREPRFRGR